MLQQRHPAPIPPPPPLQPAPLRRSTRVIRGRCRLPPYRAVAPVLPPVRQSPKEKIVKGVKPRPQFTAPPEYPDVPKKIEETKKGEDDWGNQDDWDKSPPPPVTNSPKIGDPIILETLQRLPSPVVQELEQCEDYNPVNIWVKPTPYDHYHVRKILEQVKCVAQSFGNFRPFNMPEELQEYLKQLKEMEKRRGPPFLGRSPQMTRRPDVMSYISNVCFSERYTVGTLVHSIYLYDRFSDGHNIEDQQLFLVALTCVVLAAKLEENDRDTPEMKKLHYKYLSRGTHIYFKLFLAMEIFVLRYFEFKIIVPTEVNFLDCYLIFGLDGYGTDIFYELYKYQNKRSFMGNYGDMLFDLHEYCRRLCKIVAIRAPSPPHRASLVAASILMFARRECHMNFWTKKLGEITGYEFDDVLHCLKTFVDPCVNGYTSTGKFTCKARREPVLVNFFSFKNALRGNTST